ncbi:MAG: endonuclease/exonuclease/phosphatase family protein [Woeseiaceae bacterium]|nr:endonuclease/exonuclease/phosphatase family protein [Woeseiaceae bacterium]
MSLAAVLALSSCAVQPGLPVAQVAAGESYIATDSAAAAAACRRAMSAAAPNDADYIDTGQIRIGVWNLQKSTTPGWEADFRDLADSADLLLLQEASLDGATVDELGAGRHWSFSAGYRTSRVLTGVVTLSAVAPIVHCSLVSAEPLLRTPKATSIVRFRLGTEGDTLVVANVHAVNFSLGNGAFRRQFAQLAEALGEHEGPLIVAGDFNTWRPARTGIVENFAAELGLTAVAFADDRRSQVFGRPLDHVFVRGLRALTAGATAVTTSDHNPLDVTLAP